MDHGESAPPAASTSTTHRHHHLDKKDQESPVCSRELTLQANFTFGTATMAPVQYAHVTPTSTSSLSGRPLMASGAPVEHWRWGGSGATGAQCSITCGREGLTMTYNAQPPAAAAAAGHVHHAVPCPACTSLATGRSWHLPLPQPHSPPVVATAATQDAAATTITTSITTTATSPIVTRSLVDLSRPQEQPAARRMTFSGSLDRATQRPVQQRPYGRRCKSTAHIVLQTSGSDVPREARPHEFHSTLRKDDAPSQSGGADGDRPEQEARGRARHRTTPDAVHGAVGGGQAAGYGGWERLQPLSEEQETSRRLAFEAGVPPCCACHHCSALYSLMSSLAHERTCHACAHHHHHHHHHQPCSPTPHHSQESPAYPPSATGDARTPAGPKSPTVRTFNSHRCYEEEHAGVRRQAPPGDHRLPASQPKSRTPSPRTSRRHRSSVSPRSSPSPDRRGDGAEDRHPQTTPQMPRRVPRMGAAAAAAAAASAAAAAAASTHSAVQGDGAAGGRVGSPRHRGPQARHHQRPRSRTIHIDVYCSSSDDLDSSPPSSPCSEDTHDSGSRRPHAVVALGSKQHKKTELNLSRHQYHPLEERASSFVYSRGRPRQPHASRRTTFITDDVLPMCSSPPPPPTPSDKEDVGRGGADAPSSVPAAALHSRTAIPASSGQAPIPMPAPPSRPATLAMPTSPLPQPSDNAGVRPRSSHSSLSYLSSPMDVEAWEGEPELPESALSWRGSEFETSTPRLTSELELHSPRPTSGLSLSSLHEAFCETEPEGLEAPGGLGMLDSPRLWRSPQLERQRYIQRDQEERYREALKRRAQQEAERSRTPATTPSNVMELSKLPTFKGFSREDLEVISKSLERRKSLQSSEREESIRLPGEESLEPVERRESNRLLEWMKQYKAQEGKESSKSQELKDSESLGYAESSKSLEGTDSFGSMESKESFGTVERRKSVPCSNGSLGTESSTGIQRRESQRSQELREFGQYERREPGKALEKRESFKFQDKGAYFRSLEKRESGRSSERKEYLRPSYREDSGSSIERIESLRYVDGKNLRRVVERRDSDARVERRDSGRLERRDSGRLERRDSDRLERRDSGIMERRDSGRLERRDSGRVERRDSGRVERRDSGRVERRDSGRVERRDSGRVERRDSGRVERRDSGRVERRDSGRVERIDSSRIERVDPGRVERRDSGRVERIDSGRMERMEPVRVERRDSGRVERRDSGRLVERSDSGRYVGVKDSYVSRKGSESEKRIERVQSFGSADTGRRTPTTSRDPSKSHEATTSAGVERKGSSKGSPDAKRSGFLEQLLRRDETTESGSVEWQNVVSTVRRRLSACIPSTAAEGAWLPEAEAPPVMGRAPTPTTQRDEGAMSPLSQRRTERRRDSLHSDEERSAATIVGGRIINVGFFRRMPRFPFSQTVPVPASRYLEARTACFPEQRKFVRPQLFGEMTLSYPKRRGIHFGPPRNPQCSCENCRSWAEAAPGWQVEGSRLRAWSLSDLGSGASEGPGTALPLQPGSYPGTSLSRANSNVSDSARLSYVGSAAAGGKQQ